MQTIMGAVALVFGPRKQNSAHDGGIQEHYCDEWCGRRAEKLARASIAISGNWKKELHRHGPMIYTVCGVTGCEVWLSNPSHHPYWEYRVRPMTDAERQSFLDHYGRAGRLCLVGMPLGSATVRGFVLNGRLDGWQFSTPL